MYCYCTLKYVRFFTNRIILMRANNYLLAMAGVVVIIIIKLLIPLLFKRGLCCSLGTYFLEKSCIKLSKQQEKQVQ